MTNDPLTMFDSHCHLTDTAFDPDRADTIARARAAGVTRMVTIASDPADAARAAAIAGENEGVWATAGLHPHAAATLGDEVRERIVELLDEPRVVAIGEAGLDYFYDNAPRAAQRAAFEWQLELAAERGLPVVVHARAADMDVADMIRDFAGRAHGVLHCFSSSAGLLEAGLQAGWFVSFSGLITFRKFDGADLVRAVPADRIMAETDSPYLAPVPYRGTRNEPAHVADVIAALATLRGVTVPEMATVTTANALRFYRIQG